MPTTSEIRVSIDVGCHGHSVAIGLPTGEVLEEFDLLHRPEGFDLFFAHVERHLASSEGSNGMVPISLLMWLCQ